MSSTSSVGSFENTMKMTIANNADYPSAIETLRQRSQKLAMRLQQTQREMSTMGQQHPDHPLTMLAGAPRPASITAQQQQQHQQLAQHQQAQHQQAQHQQHNNHAFPMQAPSMPAPYPFPMRPACYPMRMQLQYAPSAPAPPTSLPPQPEYRRRKSRNTLAGEVDALKDLVLKLTSTNPDIKAYAQQLINQSEVLLQLDVLQLSQQNGRTNHCFVRNPTNGPAPSNMPRMYQPMTQRRVGEMMRPRRESEMSSASNSSAPGGVAADNLAQQQQQQQGENHAARRRNRNRKKNESKDSPRSQNSELDAMRAYINKIVSQYVGGKNLLAEELVFKGDFGDLEAHAKRLAAAGYGRIVEDTIRVNRKNNRQSFITMSTDRETLDRDGIVLLPVARRYAFEGDIVRAFVLNSGAVVSKQVAAATAKTALGENEELSEEEPGSPESGSPDTDDDNVAVITSDDCPKAFVISIVKQTELRQIVGSISFTNPSSFSNDEFLFYKFRPLDMRMPMVYIPKSSCDPYIGNRHGEEVCGLLFVAHILETDNNGHCIANLVQPVGRVGNLDDEIKAILFHNNLRDIVPFEERFNAMYADAAPPIGDSDLLNRRDMRKRCVFTIDPLTARDLDDALSIEQLEGNEFEIGVHISDVSHYLEENSELDNIVKERSTSIYLANEVIHMLPQSLCFRCSLLPGEDKFAFSVFWHIDSNGKQLDKPYFTRSVINSCSQFAYEHAQKIIDNPSEQFTDDDFPSILNGFTVQDIVKRVTWLHGIATNMRNKRFDNGALTINNAKVRFNLDPITGEPVGFDVEKQREANHMIEEFMLLANQAVARFIHDSFPNIAILRNHPPPLTKSLKALREKLISQGYDLDYSSSKALQASMQRLCREAADPIAMNACLSQLLMKPMARANYFCSEGKTNEADLWHYALSIPIYTHFTSPIRRYPDVMVHRLLAAGLNYCPAPKRTCDELHQLTKIANERKYNAKLAGDESGNLFFKRYVSNRQAIYMRAVVIEIFQHMMNVVTLESGHVISINYQMQRVLIDVQNAPNFIIVTERNLPQQPTKLQLLSVIPIRLIIWDGKLTGFLLSAEQRLNGPSIESPGKDNKKNQKQQVQNKQKSNNSNNKNKAPKSAQKQQQQQQPKQHQQPPERVFYLRKEST